MDTNIHNFDIDILMYWDRKLSDAHRSEVYNGGVGWEHI